MNGYGFPDGDAGSNPRGALAARACSAAQPGTRLSCGGATVLSRCGGATEGVQRSGHNLKKYGDEKRFKKIAAPSFGQIVLISVTAMRNSNFCFTLRAVAFVVLYLFDTTDSTGLTGIVSRYPSIPQPRSAARTNTGFEPCTLRNTAVEQQLIALRGGEDRKLRIALCSWECLYTVAVGGVAPHVTELAAGLTRRYNRLHR